MAGTAAGDDFEHHDYVEHHNQRDGDHPERVTNVEYHVEYHVEHHVEHHIINIEHDVVD